MDEKPPDRPDRPDRPRNLHSLLDWLQEIWRALVDWLWRAARADEPRWQQISRPLLRTIFIFSREFQQDHITLRASALTYTVVLSLVPTLALGTAVLKGLGAGDQMRQAAHHFIDKIEAGGQSPATPEPSAVPGPEEQQSREAAPGSETAGAAEISSHLRTAVDKIFNYVDRTNFATLGAFGIFGVLVAAISVLSTIENAMNTIWQAGGERPLGRKVMDYLALLVLLPLTLNLALAAMATLQSPALLERWHSLMPLDWVTDLLLKGLPIIAVVATVTILYRFLPNAKVKLFPAFIGGLVGGIGWLLAEALYFKLQIGVARYNAIYGSFATLPLLFVWIYVGWVVFLSGAEVAFAAQAWRHYPWQELKLTPLTRLALALDILRLTLADFAGRQKTEHPGLIRRLGQPEPFTISVLNDLLQAGLLLQVEGVARYVPAAPADQITPAEIIDVIFGTAAPVSAGGRLATEALASAKTTLAGQDIFHADPPDLR